MKDSLVNPFAWMCAAVGAILVHVPIFTWLLVLLMLIDMAFGIGRAYVQKDLSANEARVGAIKKLGNLGIIAVAGIVEALLLSVGVIIPGVNFVQVATLFFVPYEVFSIVKNADALGIPIPPQLLAAMRYFKEANNASDDSIPKDPGGASS